MKSQTVEGSAIEPTIPEIRSAIAILKWLEAETRHDFTSLSLGETNADKARYWVNRGGARAAEIMSVEAMLHGRLANIPAPAITGNIVDMLVAKIGGAR